MFKTLRTEEILESLNGNPQAWPEALVARTIGQNYEYQDNVTVLSVTAARRDTLKLPPPAASVSNSQKTVQTFPPQMFPAKQRSYKRLVMAIVIGIVVLTIAGGGARWWYKKHHAAHVSEQK